MKENENNKQMLSIPEINQRILDTLAYKGYTGYRLEKENSGIKQVQISHIKKGRNKPSLDLINALVSKFNDINKDWLLTGEGEMIAMEGRSLDQNFHVAEPNARYGKDSVTQQPEGDYMEVEFRDLSVSAGPLSRNSTKERKKTMLVPKEYDRGEYLVARVDGPSMDDGSVYSIPSGAYILIKRIYLEKGERLPIRDNLFVIDAVDGQGLKQIIEHNTDLGYIVCHSYNPEFKDYTVPMQDILGIYIFRKIVGFRPPIRDL